MNKLNPEAEELNTIIKESKPTIYRLLSEKGKAIFFPKKGNLTQGAEAKGKKINATIGMAIEDDGTPMRLPAIANEVSLDPKNVFPYASSYGLRDLRKTWQKLIREKNPSLKGKISLPVVTNGLSHGLSMVGYLFTDPGNKIVVTDVLWENYTLIFEHGYSARLQPFNIFKNGCFDTGSLKNTLAKQEGKQIILLNFPHNPTGYTLTEEEAHKVTEIIRESAERGNEIVAVLDDAYFGLSYETGICKESPFSKLADVHENVLAIKLDGATKEDYAWGLRVGFVTYASKGANEKTYQALEDKTAGAIRGSISNASHLSQSLLLRAITSDAYKDEKREKYNLLKRRFDKVQEVLSRNKKNYSNYFSALPFNSGYFMCIELREGLNAERIRQTLLNKYSTGVIAVGNLLRIAFSSVPEKDIPTLFNNIYNACKKESRHQ